MCATGRHLHGRYVQLCRHDFFHFVSPYTLTVVNTQKGHVLRVKFVCAKCHKQTRIWSSSRIFSGHYLVNQKYIPVYYMCGYDHGLLVRRLVHAFTSAGVLPSQYKRMSMFAEMGVVGRGYIDQG